MSKLVCGTLIVMAFLTGAALAQDSCSALWLERNQIYKDAGYCFKTARAIRTFGNAGCVYDFEGEVALSVQERRRVAEIVRTERYLGCSR